jgi:hypothetical protein
LERFTALPCAFGGFGQSASDRQNPVIAELGHVALNIPDYAT